MPQYRVKTGHKLVTTDGEALGGQVVELPADVAEQYPGSLEAVEAVQATQAEQAAQAAPQAPTQAASE